MPGIFYLSKPYGRLVQVSMYRREVPAPVAAWRLVKRCHRRICAPPVVVSVARSAMVYNTFMQQLVLYSRLRSCPQRALGRTQDRKATTQTLQAAELQRLTLDCREMAGVRRCRGTVSPNQPCTSLGKLQSSGISSPDRGKYGVAVASRRHTINRNTQSRSNVVTRQQGLLRMLHRNSPYWSQYISRSSRSVTAALREKRIDTSYTTSGTSLVSKVSSTSTLDARTPRRNRWTQHTAYDQLQTSVSAYYKRYAMAF